MTKRRKGSTKATIQRRREAGADVENKSIKK